MTLLDEAPAARTSVRREPTEAGPPPAHVWAGWHVDVGRTFIVAAALVLWILAYVTWLSGLEQKHAQRELYERFRTELALTTAPIGAPIDSGAPVALISIPRVGIKNLVVVEGTSARDLKDGPGHLRGSVLPGQTGTSVVLGKALTYGGPFGSLDQLRVGDPIKVTTQQGTFTYSVSGARKKGDRVPAAPTGTQGRLVLATAFGGGWLSHFTPSDTIYFDAQVEKAVGPGPRSTMVPDEQPMKSSVTGGELAQLALALQLLLITFVGVAWARLRWSPIAAWVVGVPTVIASLWLVSTLAAQLIPNLV